MAAARRLLRSRHSASERKQLQHDKAERLMAAKTPHAAEAAASQPAARTLQDPQDQNDVGPPSVPPVSGRDTGRQKYRARRVLAAAKGLGRILPIPCSAVVPFRHNSLRLPHRCGRLARFLDKPA